MTTVVPGKRSYRDLVQEAPRDFRVHSSVYRDPEIFEQEMAHLFERSWVYVAHTSEVAQPGDYRTGRIGRQPIIITRAKDGSIHVLLNVCRHRANAVCREERGNSFNFRCPYHAWTFTNTGSLIGVADRPRFPDGFDAHQLDLLPAARVGVYRGLIFASLSPDVPSFEEHIAPIKEHIALWADRSLEGESQLLLPHRYAYRGNWKFQAENGVDGYHPGIVHESAFSTYAAFGVPGFAVDAPAIRHGGITRGFPGGHSTLEGGPEQGRGLGRSLPDLYQQYAGTLQQRHGERAKQVMGNQHLFIFPNMFLFDELVRVIQPIDIDHTEIASYPFHVGGMPDAFNARRLYEVTRQLSTTGLVNPADLEMFAANQSGLQARNLEWLVLVRGMDQESSLPTGERVGVYADEVPQRSFYRHWVQAMAKEAARP